MTRVISFIAILALLAGCSESPTAPSATNAPGVGNTPSAGSNAPSAVNTANPLAPESSLLPADGTAGTAPMQVAADFDGQGSFTQGTEPPRVGGDSDDQWSLVERREPNQVARDSHDRWTFVARENTSYPHRTSNRYREVVITIPEAPGSANSWWIRYESRESWAEDGGRHYRSFRESESITVTKNNLWASVTYDVDAKPYTGSRANDDWRRVGTFRTPSCPDGTQHHDGVFRGERVDWENPYRCEPEVVVAPPNPVPAGMITVAEAEEWRRVRGEDRDPAEITDFAIALKRGYDEGIYAPIFIFHEVTVVIEDENDEVIDRIHYPAQCPAGYTLRRNKYADPGGSAGTNYRDGCAFAGNYN